MGRGKREMRIPGFTAEASIYNTSNSYYAAYGAFAGNALASEHNRVIGTPLPAVVSSAIQPARIFARQPELDGQGQFGVEVGGPAQPATGGCWYGNWCGPGCGSGTPIDNLDACCMAHDMCYSARGFGACSCDLDLVGCAFPKQFEFWRPLKAIAAGTIVGLFTGRLSSGVCLPERETGGGGGTRPPTCSVDVCPPLGALQCCGGLRCQNGLCVPPGGYPL